MIEQRLNRSFRHLCLPLLIAALAGCSSVQWQTVDTPLSTAGTEGLVELTAVPADETYHHEYPALEADALWQALLVVLSQESLIVAVDDAQWQVLALLDDDSPPLKIRVDNSRPGALRAEIGWYRSVYAVPQDAYVQIAQDERPGSVVPPWRGLQATSERLLGQIATQAYARDSWSFLREVE